MADRFSDWLRFKISILENCTCDEVVTWLVCPLCDAKKSLGGFFFFSFCHYNSNIASTAGHSFNIESYGKIFYCYFYLKPLSHLTANFYDIFM